MSGLLGAIVAILAIMVIAWLVFVAVLWLHRPTRMLAAAAIRLPPDVLRLSRALIRDPGTPRSVKIVLGVLAAYLVSPFDLIPEFIPVIGSLDDVIVAGLALRWVARRVGRETIEAHWTGTQAGLGWLLRLV